MPSTSAARGRHSTTGSPRGTRAASWCCGSRTPTASARPRRTSSRSSTRCAGWSSTGTRGRSRRPRAATATRRRCERCSSPAPPTATRRPPRRSRPGRPSTAPTAATGASPATTRGAAVRLRVPDEGETVVEDLIRGPVSFPNRSYDDFVIARGDGSRPLQLRGRRRRRRDGDHRRRPRRRPPLQHAQAAAGPRRPRPRAPRATRTCRCCTGPTARKLSKRHGAASVQELREARLPARGGPQLPGAARLGRRRRRHPDLDRRSWSSASGSRTSAAPRRSSTRRSCAGSTAATCASCRSTSTRRRSRRHLGREPDERLRAACEIAQEKAQTLDEVWPLIRFLFEPPVEDEKAWRRR